MNFKEFLEKESGWIDSWQERDKKDVHPSHELQIISVKALGNWAWENVTKTNLDLWNIGFLGTKNWENINYLLRKHLDWQIAVVCLGEKNVKQRLSEMK